MPEALAQLGTLMCFGLNSFTAACDKQDVVLTTYSYVLFFVNTKLNVKRGYTILDNKHFECMNTFKKTVKSIKRLSKEI